MKYNNFIKAFCFLAVAAVATSCQDNVVVGTADADRYIAGESPVLYITDDAGKSIVSVAEFRTAGTMNLYLHSNVSSSASVTLAYDQKVLDEYNAANGTSYAAFPQANVTLPGSIALSNNIVSAPAEVKMTSPGNLDPNTPYVIPVKITTSGGNMKKGQENRIIFVKDISAFGDVAKYVTDSEGVEHRMMILRCPEINDCNPLNHLCYTLKNSGKYITDAVILFSSNVNYDEATGEVYISNSENLQAVYENSEKYLKPLKDRGMKIYLSLLGNHDRSGVANLSDAACKEFAKKIKAYCDAYNLDGVFYDDEYSSYVSPPPAGFVQQSRAAYSRLLYEVWKLQPYRDNISYVYSTGSAVSSVEGVQGGEFCHYALHDYLRSSDLSSSFPGMPKDRMGMYSQECAQGRYASASNLKAKKDQGYCSHMYFAMNPYIREGNTRTALSRIAQGYFDDEVVYNGNPLPMDWK